MLRTRPPLAIYPALITPLSCVITICVHEFLFSLLKVEIHDYTGDSHLKESVLDKLPARLACVKHAASVHPEPGSNSQI